jgi:hypothetical protein
MKTILTLLIPLIFIFNSTNLYSQYSAEEKSSLLYTLQEEKVAFDFYNEMFTKYSEKVFENVSSAEKTHQEHVLNLLNELNINAESYNQNAGEFSTKELQDMYNLLIKTGNYSFTDALLASARYEEKDISDLKNYRSKASNENIISLFECLEKASQNHLRAFVKNLKTEGITYKSSVLSAEEFNEIINSKNQGGDCFQSK